MLKFCTLTGADDRTHIPTMLDISRRYPFVEWGILFYPSRFGTDRNPSPGWVSKFLDAVERQGSHINTSIHICNDGVPSFLNGDGVILDIARRFGRVQLNYNFSRINDDAFIRTGVNRVNPQKVITQYFPPNEHLWNGPLNGAPNHQVLFDKSRGKGILPDSYHAPLYSVICGYAGGLGIHNLEEELPKIARAAMSYDYWIDMESSLRASADGFKLDGCERVLRYVRDWKNKNEKGLLSSPFPEGDLSNLFATIPASGVY